MTNVVFDESMLGASLRITNPGGEVVEGVCSGYEPALKMVLLEQSTGGSEGKTTLRMLSTTSATGIAVVAPAPKISSDTMAKKPPLPPINMEAMTNRERIALKKAYDDGELVNTSVTMRTQRIFDSLRKTMPCEWRGNDILVLNDICISSPYLPTSCTGEGAALNRVKKVLAGELEKLALQ